MSSTRDKRRLRDTRLGQWLTEKAPTVPDAVGDVLPDRGVLGVVKNLVDGQPGLTHDQRMEFEPQLMIDSLPEGYPMRAYPTWFVIGRDGQVAHRDMGYGEGTDAVLDSVVRANL